MTYGQLLAFLKELNKEELDLDVTIHDQHDDEYIKANEITRVVKTDVLDRAHPIITIG